MWGIYWLAEELSASQEGLCFMEIAGWLVIVFSMQTEMAEDTKKTWRISAIHALERASDPKTVAACLKANTSGTVQSGSGPQDADTNAIQHISCSSIHPKPLSDTASHDSTTNSRVLSFSQRSLREFTSSEV
jgi:hypothetical protein